MRRALLWIGCLVFACDASAPATDAGLDAAMDGGLDAGRDGGPRRRDAGPDAGPLCDPTDVTLPDPLVCNGHAELCDRSYADVTFAMAHNAMSSEEERWIAPNQGLRLWRQLELGVRGFMLDTYREDGVTLLCHGFCVLGSRPFADALRDLRLFMDCHPAEVLTLILEAHIDEATTAAAFEEAGLMPYLHAQPAGDPDWPTLRAMIESGRRLVVFTEDGSTTLDWYMPAYQHMWDTDYHAERPSDFSCDVLRGSRANRLFLLNHFLTSPVASRSLAEMVNHDPLLIDRARQCQAETGFLPNFVALDFVDTGDLIEAVDLLNGL